MSMTLSEVAAAAMVAGLRYRYDETLGMILVGFGETGFRDPNTGEHSIVIVLMLGDDGRTLQVFLPACYDLSECEHREAAFSCFLQICYRTSLLQFEYDADSGHVHYVCELPIEDGKLTAAQIGRVVSQMVHALEYFDPIVQRSMATGETDFDDADVDDGDDEGEGADRPPLELADLIRAAGGVEGLRRLLSDAGRV
ncbi:MAG: hypothetical protein KDA22_10595 [Phycisphaerales bacterium]|nr:hypothetical protein [Phycisphaerales bacterium]